MQPLLHLLRQHGVLSPSQYWHLRLLSTLALGPLLGVLYLVYLRWRTPRTPSPPPTMWVSSNGQLLIRRARP